MDPYGSFWILKNTNRLQNLFPGINENLPNLFLLTEFVAVYYDSSKFDNLHNSLESIGEDSSIWIL